MSGAVAAQAPDAGRPRGDAASGAFSPFAVAGMLGVGLLCFVAFAVLLAFSGGPGSRDGGSHAASRSAIGFAGVAELLRGTGTPVVVSRDLSGGGPDAGLIVLTPQPSVQRPASMPSLTATSVLVVLPKWQVAPAEEQPGWVRPTGLLSDSRVLGVLPTDWRGISLRRQTGKQRPSLRASGVLRDVPALSALPQVDRLQTLTARGFTALLHDRDGGIVLGQREEDGTYVLSDPDLLNNLALAEATGAEAAVALVRALGDGPGVAFDVSLNGLARSRNPLRMILEPPLLGATLCAVAAAIAVGLLSARRFGPARLAERIHNFGKRALADNAASLIALARRQPRMARPYAELTRSLAARAAGAPRALPPAELEAYLDRAAAQRSAPDRLADLVHEADAVRDTPALLRLARRLHGWRMAFTHGRS